jgi:hypothetical protein
MKSPDEREEDSAAASLGVAMAVLLSHLLFEIKLRDPDFATALAKRYRKVLDDDEWLNRSPETRRIIEDFANLMSLGVKE